MHGETISSNNFMSFEHLNTFAANDIAGCTMSSNFSFSTLALKSVLFASIAMKHLHQQQVKSSSSSDTITALGNSAHLSMLNLSFFCACLVVNGVVSNIQYFVSFLLEHLSHMSSRTLTLKSFNFAYLMT